MGDRRAELARALNGIARFAEIVRVSPVYETAPVGGPPQGAFLNAAARVRYRGTPLALLDALLALEVEMGRVRRERWGPRGIDLDLLFVRGVALDSPRLVLPHPRLHERPFALVPLHDVESDAPFPSPDAPGPIVARGAWWREQSAV